MDLHEFCKWIINFLKPIFQVKKDFFQFTNFLNQFEFINKFLIYGKHFEFFRMDFAFLKIHFRNFAN